MVWTRVHVLTYCHTWRGSWRDCDSGITSDETMLVML